VIQPGPTKCIVSTRILPELAAYMRTRNGRRKVLFGTNYPMIFHEPALADLDALVLDDEARELYLSANAQRLFEGGPRRLLCLGERERAGWRVCARNGRRGPLSAAARDGRRDTPRFRPQQH
jgi:hypothetical protein